MASTPKKEEPKIVIEPVNIDAIPNLNEAIAHFKQESIDGMWTEATHPFAVRGPNYLKDKVKVPSPEPVFRIIHCELVTTADKKCTFFLESRMNLVSTLAQSAVPDTPHPFFFVLHIQVPGTPMLSLMVYWILDITRNPDPKYIAFLEKFVTGDQKYKDSRFKIIPNILEGPRGISRLVGNRPVLLGHKVTMHYFAGANFIELDIDVASSRVAKHVVGQCREYAKLIVVDLGIVLQGEAEDELPEQLLATIQFKNMDMKQWIPRDILPGINPADEVVEGNPSTPNQAPADFDESLEDGDVGNADTDDEPITGQSEDNVKEPRSP